MTIVKYPIGKYSPEQLRELALELKSTDPDTLFIPDDLSVLEDVDDKILLDIINKIRNILDKKRYIRKCQWENDEFKSDKIPCGNGEKLCMSCPYFYSDDDARWS